jgi:hypothetical protein
LTKKIDSSEIYFIELDLPFVSEININNTNSQFIEFDYTSRGEYKNATFVSSILEKNKVSITEKLISNSTDFNDKLSIHKNYLTSFNISFPKNLTLKLSVENSTTKINAKMEQIDFFQNTGNIYLGEWDSPGKIQTISANIYFNNHKIKILSTLKESLNCYTFESDSIIEVETLSGRLKCITF